MEAHIPGFIILHHDSWTLGEHFVLYYTITTTRDSPIKYGHNFQILVQNLCSILRHEKCSLGSSYVQLFQCLESSQELSYATLCFKHKCFVLLKSLKFL